MAVPVAGLRAAKLVGSIVLSMWSSWRCRPARIVPKFVLNVCNSPATAITRRRISLSLPVKPVCWNTVPEVKWDVSDFVDSEIP